MTKTRAVDLQSAESSRVRRVEYLERRAVRPSEDQRREARAAHPADDDALAPVSLHQARELCRALEHAQRLVEPPEPVRLVASRPDCRVTLPDPLEKLARVQIRQY